MSNNGYYLKLWVKLHPLTTSHPCNLLDFFLHLRGNSCPWSTRSIRLLQLIHLFLSDILGYRKITNSIWDYWFRSLAKRVFSLHLHRERPIKESFLLETSTSRLGKSFGSSKRPRRNGESRRKLASGKSSWKSWKRNVPGEKYVFVRLICFPR